MSPAFLFFANVVLLARLVVLFQDESPAGRSWLVKAGVELAVLLACYPVSPAWGGATLTVVAMNLLGWRWERRARAPWKNLGRLAHGLGGLLVLSVFFSPALGLELREQVVGPGMRALAQWTALGGLLSAALGAAAHPFLFGLLLAANEANLFIRAAFDWLGLKPHVAPQGQGVVDVREFNRGRIIGLLERALLYVFLLQGQYGAIGFVLAAKAFTRFKALDDRPFAEYVLIGTLLSAGCALLAVLVARAA